jgi:multisubunit Na+/H+ antiporter MnhB subunit
MPGIDPRTLTKLVEGLAIVFYVGMLVSLLTAVAGAPGWAFLTLVLGASALIVRTALEGTAPKWHSHDP